MTVMLIAWICSLKLEFTVFDVEMLAVIYNVFS